MYIAYIFLKLHSVGGHNAPCSIEDWWFARRKQIFGFPSLHLLSGPGLKTFSMGWLQKIEAKWQPLAQRQAHNNACTIPTQKKVNTNLFKILNHYFYVQQLTTKDFIIRFNIKEKNTSPTLLRACLMDLHFWWTPTHVLYCLHFSLQFFALCFTLQR